MILGKWIIAMTVLTNLGAGAITSVTGDLTKPAFNALKAYHDREQIGLEQYKKENDQKLKQVVAETKNESVYATITFRNYLSDDELQQVIADYGIQTKYVLVRAIEKGTGLRVTSFIGNYGETDAMRLQEEMLGRNGADFKGYIELVGSIPVEKVEALATENTVYMIDPSADSYLVRITDHDYVPGVFWDLEDEGLVQQ